MNPTKRTFEFISMISATPSSKVVLLVVLAFLVICGVCLNNIVIYTPDSARYVAWATSLGSFDGYFDETGPDPSRYVIHAPLYPLLLAPIAGLFPYDVCALKIGTILMGAFTILSFAVWMRKLGVSVVALGTACALLATNPLMILYSTQVLSDVAFAGCLIWFITLLDQFRDKSGLKQTMVLCAVATAAVFLREVGLTVLMAGSVFFVIRKEYQRASVLFLLPFTCYLLWFVRNEFIVASVEFPTMRNSQVFLTHLFTPQQASLLDEFRERLLSNLSVYGDLFGKVVFLPEFVTRTYGAVSKDNILVQSMFIYVRFAQIPLVAATLGFSLFGLVSRWKESGSGLITILFLGFYSLPVLLYPINDIRFLLPVIPLMLYHGSAGAARAYALIRTKWPSRALPFIAAAAVIICALPNSVWLVNFTESSRLYGAVIDGKQPLDALQGLPDHFKRPADLAGKWINQNTDSTTRVGSVWKELYFWMGGRKIVEVNPHIILDAFENLIRDYRIGYLVSAVGVSGLREYELQMASSRNYDFETVYRVGNLEILRVLSKRKQDNSARKNILPSKRNRQEQEIQTQLRLGLRLLQSDPLTAEKVFTNIWNSRGSFGTVVFFTAIAKEFNDSLDQASELFAKFRSIPQAGSLLTQSWYHQEIISRLKVAKEEPNPQKKAERFHILAINYWELGFRTRAVSMLSQSLQADAKFFPSLVFGSLYAFQNGDTLLARNYYNLAASQDASNELVKAFSGVFKRIDSLKLNRDVHEQARLKLGIAREYVRMGLRETAIDQLLDIAESNPGMTEAMELLVETYEIKRRVGTALEWTERILQVDPANLFAKQKRTQLMERW